MINGIFALAAAFILASCVTDEQGTLIQLTAPATPATCKDALYEVVQARRAYDLGMAGTEEVRQAVLHANSLCGQ